MCYISIVTNIYYNYEYEITIQLLCWILLQLKPPFKVYICGLPFLNFVVHITIDEVQTFKKTVRGKANDE